MKDVSVVFGWDWFPMVFFAFRNGRFTNWTCNFFQSKGRWTSRSSFAFWWSFTQWFTHPYDWLKHTSMYEAMWLCVLNFSIWNSPAQATTSLARKKPVVLSIYHSPAATNFGENILVFLGFTKSSPQNCVHQKKSKDSSEKGRPFIGNGELSNLKLKDWESWPQAESRLESPGKKVGSVFVSFSPSPTNWKRCFFWGEKIGG